MTLCLVHLVWAPLGPEPLQRFIASYQRHPAGIEHRLLVVMKGFPPGADRTAWHQTLAAVAHDELDAEAGGLDLATYRDVIDQVPAERYCFTNSGSTVLADDWLALIDRCVDAGMAGSAGTYESPYTAAPRWLRPLRRRVFPPFPNPHLRTNGFALSGSLARSLDWPRPRRKPQAWALESGRHSLTRQVLARGLAAVVVGRDGVAYPPERWRESATFRRGGQRNLLISDNRTRQYDEAGPELRRRLEQLSWGPPD